MTEDNDNEGQQTLGCNTSLGHTMQRFPKLVGIKTASGEKADHLSAKHIAKTNPWAQTNFFTLRS